ncbi:hypothetical protein V1509DRAFT_619149 [Lipomyces kononenkoae]
MEKIPDFIDFLLANDVEISPYVDICYAPSRGYHVLLSPEVKSSIARNTPLARIPKTVVLSASSSVLANLLPDQDQRSLAGLVLAYLTERAMGDRSPWFCYIDILPNREQSCLRFWDQGELEWVRATDATDILWAADEDLTEMYDTVAEPFFAAQGETIRAIIGENISWETFTSKETFADAVSVVAARCFEIDAFVGLGLCPVADLFNHSDHEDVRFETRFEVCEWCGSENTCEHDAHAIRDAAGEDLDAGSPELEDGNIDELNDASVDAVDAADDDDDDNDDDEKDTCDIVVHRRIGFSRNSSVVQQTREIFNSYGSLSNAQLLVKYGFAIRRNAHDYLSLEREVRSLYREKGIPWHGVVDRHDNVGKGTNMEYLHSIQYELEETNDEDESAAHYGGVQHNRMANSDGKGELKIDIHGRISLRLWDRLVQYCALTGSSPSRGAYHEILGILNSAPKSLANRLSGTSRHVIETVLVVLGRRWDRYPDGGISSAEYDYVISEEEVVASREVADREYRKRNALIVLANEKQMLELAKQRCEKALGMA